MRSEMHGCCHPPASLMASDQMDGHCLPVIPSRMEEMEMEIRDGNLPLVNAVELGVGLGSPLISATFWSVVWIERGEIHVSQNHLPKKISCMTSTKCWRFLKIYYAVRAQIWAGSQISTQLPFFANIVQ